MSLTTPCLASLASVTARCARAALPPTARSRAALRPAVPILAAVVVDRLASGRLSRTARAFCAALMASAALPWGRPGAEAAQVRLLEHGADHATIEYTSEPDDDPLAQTVVAVLGVPLDAQPVAEVLAAVARPGADRAWESPAARAAMVPGPVTLRPPGFLRDQRVVELACGPRCGAAGPCEAFARIVVRVSFPSAGQPGQPLSAGRWGEAYLRHLLLNYEQARAWRRPRATPAARPAQQTAAGPRLRVRVREEGMYRLTGAELEDAGLPVSQYPAAALHLLYGGGLALPEDSRGVELQELPLLVEDGGDGRLDRGDRVLFYGEAPARWEYDPDQQAYRFVRNLYTHDNVYWLGIDPGREGSRAAVHASAAAGPSEPVTVYRERVHEELEQYIAVQTYTISSGYEWYWEAFSGNARNYPFLIRQAAPDSVDITIQLHGLSGYHARFDASWNGQALATFSLLGDGYRQQRLRAPAPREGDNQLGLVHTNSVPARLDWIELEYSRQLAAERGELRFDAPAGSEGSAYRLTGFGAVRPRVFQVRPELAEIVDFAHSASDGTVTFAAAAQAVPPRYVALTEAQWRRPLALELDRPSSLRAPGQGAEYLIVTHRDFGAAAARLAAWRGRDDRFGAPLQTAVVDIEDVYDEFSGGMLDPAALRAFLRHAAEQWQPAPFFVLLLGDGTYDYKNNSGGSPGNWVPAYQNEESTYDEWYACVSGDDVLPDMAIGRLPVQTAAEAEQVVDKLLDYDRQVEAGPWQSRGLLVADDTRNPQEPTSVETSFLLDAEYLARALLPADLDLRKLYLAQYPLDGQTKPRAQAEFLRQFNAGALYLTYIGHGNPDVLAHERVFVVSRDLHEVRNGRRLPLMYTAASQVGVFDDPLRVSMPEALLRRQEGGVIGMICATRVGYHDSNMLLANQVHRELFRGATRHVPVGMALMAAKRRVQAGTQGLAQLNIRRYSLFGDPAQYLAWPRYQVQLSLPDTLRALAEVEVDGVVLDDAGRPLPDCQGQAWVQAFDSSLLSELDGLLYQAEGAPLLRGLYPVRDGRFRAAFRVPKDISYRGEDGRVSAYVWQTGQPPAFGAVRGLALAGTAAGPAADDSGPQIALGIVGQPGFASGDAVPPGAVLRATLSDPGGINITGETGHEILLWIDGQAQAVTELFAADGDYRTGHLDFPLPLQEPGPHLIRLKAWDSFNNSAQAEIAVRVSDRPEVLLTAVLFHPNPLTGGAGRFTFWLATAATGARVRIFALSGRLVDQVRGGAAAGFNQLVWEPPAGLANGAYLYRLDVERAAGPPLERAGVLQLLR